MVISRKLVTAIVTAALSYVVVLVVNHFSLHLNPQTASTVAEYVSLAAGAIAGYIVKEVADL